MKKTPFNFLFTENQLYFLFIATLIQLPMNAHANSFGKFVEFSANVMKLNGDKFRSFPSAGYITGGQYISENFAVVAEFGGNIAEDSAYFENSMSKFQFTSKLDHYIGVGVLHDYNILNRYYFFGAVYISEIKVTVFDSESNPDPQRGSLCSLIGGSCQSVSGSMTGISISLGAQYAIRDNNFVAINYRMHPQVNMDKLDASFFSSSAGLSYKLFFN